MKPTLRKGDSGTYVKELQRKLNFVINTNLVVDGLFGAGTEAAVIHFQSSQGLQADGICGNQTWAALDNAVDEGSDGDDLKFSPVVDSYYPLGAGEFVNEFSSKVGATLHHTVSDGDPFRVVDIWEQDSRGAVGTHFVIGRTKINGDTTHNGTIVQCVDLDKWLYHISTQRMGFSSSHNATINRSYVGIELCSYGCLMKTEGGFYDMSGSIRIPDDQVIELEMPNRTYKYWHKYTDEQIEATGELLLELSRHFNWDLKKGFPWAIDEQFFEQISWNALSAMQTLTSHTSFEYGKFDAYADPRLIDKLNEIRA